MWMKVRSTWMTEIAIQSHTFSLSVSILTNFTNVFVGLPVEVIIGTMDFEDYYNVSHIMNGCFKHLQKILDEGNAIMILVTARLCGKKELRNKVLEFIDRISNRNPMPVCDSDELRDADAETLFEIFKTDTLSMDESHVFNFSIAWAVKKCNEMDLEPIHENKRKILGPAFFEIRFALLPATKISDLIHSGCLSRDEGLKILNFDSGKRTVEHKKIALNVPFKSNPRIFSQKKIILTERAGGEICRVEAKLVIAGLPLETNEIQVGAPVSDVPDNWSGSEKIYWKMGGIQS